MEENTSYDTDTSSKSEGLLVELSADIDVMYKYARRRGINLPSKLLKDISRLMAPAESQPELSKPFPENANQTSEDTLGADI